MRVLRITAFPSPDSSFTMVTRDCDLSDTLEAMLQTQYRENIFVAHEIFSMTDGTPFERAVRAAADRIDFDRERAMAILYFHDVKMLAKASDNGLLTTSYPAPLDSAQVKSVLRQIAIHPDYTGQTINVHDENGAVVTLRDGELL